MTTTPAGLASVLAVAPQPDGTYLGGVLPGSRLTRLFGGLVLAQALAAAGAGVERAPHSLHAYFLRAGSTEEPVRYRVDVLRSGRAFTTHRVTAEQAGRPILTMSASFHDPEAGLTHQIPTPDAPDPSTLPSVHDRYDSEPVIYREWPWIDLRRVPRTEGADPTRSRVWCRILEPLADDPLVRACALAAMSDLSFLAVVLGTHDVELRHEGYLMASLDHAMWFHRSLPTHDWLLYDQRSPVASQGLGLATGHIFASGGELVATVAQEGLIRPLGTD